MDFDNSYKTMEFVFHQLVTNATLYIIKIDLQFAREKKNY